MSFADNFRIGRRVTPGKAKPENPCEPIDDKELQARVAYVIQILHYQSTRYPENNYYNMSLAVAEQDLMQREQREWVHPEEVVTELHDKITKIVSSISQLDVDRKNKTNNSYWVALCNMYPEEIYNDYLDHKPRAIPNQGSSPPPLGRGKGKGS